MSIKTKFENNHEDISFYTWCQSLLDLYSTEKQYTYADKTYKGSYLSMQRWILGKHFTGSNEVLRKMLLDAVLSSIGGGIYVPWFLYNDNVSSASFRFSSESYLDYTLALTKDQKVKQVFRAIYDVVGPLTKIIVKKSYEPNVTLKYRNSYRFPLRLDAQFHRMIGHNEFIEQPNPLVIMIEGAPETIGEIHPLLEKNHDDGRPVLLIARSFPEEVSATLASNWLKGSLSILPVTYGDSIETINLAADLCAVTQGELISPHFGDLIVTSILQEDKQGTVDYLYWDSTGVSFEKNVDTSGHVKHLLSKIKQSDNSELVELYQQRILSLSNDAIEVWVPNEETKLIDELDSLIKHYNAFVHSGAVKTPLGYLPNSFIINAQTTAASLQEKILNIGGFLVRVTTDDNLVA